MADSDSERKVDLDVLHYLKENPNSKALTIGKFVVGCTSRKGVNPRLYRLEKEGLIEHDHSQPPLWKLTEQGIGRLTNVGNGDGPKSRLDSPVNTQTGSRHASGDSVTGGSSSSRTSASRHVSGDTVTGGSAGSRSSAGASRHASRDSATGNSSVSRVSTGRHSSGDTSRGLVSLHSETHNSPNDDAQMKVVQYEALAKDFIDGVKKINLSLVGSRTCYDDYELVKVLGRGGFGVVLEAKRKDLDCGQYAIKIIKMHDKPELREKMTREVMAMVQLNHPNIVRYYNSSFESTLPSLVDGKPVGLTDTVDYWQTHDMDSKTSTASSFGDVMFAENASPLKESFYCGSSSGAQLSKSTKHEESDDFPLMRSKSTTAAVSTRRSGDSACCSTFLVIFMELCGGGSLADWLTKNVKVKDRQKGKILKIFKSTVKAIDYLHGKNLMHRDIKPENILFDGSGNIKVSDFGLAKGFGLPVVGDTSETVEGDDAQFVGCHTANKGTPSYMSPEQETNIYDNKVDIYALGIVLVELWCPFRSGHERQKCFENLRLCRPVFPDNLPQELIQNIDFVETMLSHEPSVRPTAIQILEFIKKLN